MYGCGVADLHLIRVGVGTETGSEIESKSQKGKESERGKTLLSHAPRLKLANSKTK
jgi:hypothetical protein